MENYATPKPYHFPINCLTLHLSLLEVVPAFGCSNRDEGIILTYTRTLHYLPVSSISYLLLKYVRGRIANVEKNRIVGIERKYFIII